MKTKHPVAKPLVERMKELGYERPTPIQEHAWKNLLEKHQDYVGQAHTGSGKTVAYGVPLMQRIDASDKDIQALVLVPTRELVNQTAKTLFRLSKYLPKCYVETVMGGEPIEDQQFRLSRPSQVLVATPGRLLELLKLKAVSLRRVKTIVLDEADELYAKGFFKEIDKILGYTNDFHKKWLFSATIHGELKNWIKKTLHADAPQLLATLDDVMNPNIEHQYLECQKEEKPALLMELIQDMGTAQGLVFCRTQGDIEFVQRFLKENEVKALAMHGEMGMRDREKVLRLFHQKQAQVIVASDVAARGIDFQDVAYVVHYQLPDDPDYYTHRSGRTARAGKRGLSISFVEPVERKKMRYLQDLLSVMFIQL